MRKDGLPSSPPPRERVHLAGLELQRVHAGVVASDEEVGALGFEAGRGVAVLRVGEVSLNSVQEGTGEESIPPGGKGSKKVLGSFVKTG